MRWLRRALYQEAKKMVGLKPEWQLYRDQKLGEGKGSPAPGREKFGVGVGVRSAWRSHRC